MVYNSQVYSRKCDNIISVEDDIEKKNIEDAIIFAIIKQGVASLIFHLGF